MRSFGLSFLLFLALTGGFPMAVWAGQAEAREAARLNNCAPKKIEVYSQSLGADSQTLYRVDCTMPKAKGPATPNAPEALLIGCEGALCTLVRPLDKSEK